MIEARLLLYVMGAIFAMLMAGQLLKVPDTTARLFGVVWLVWCVNCVVFGTALVCKHILGIQATWFEWSLMVNAFLLAMTPLAVYLLFPRGVSDAS